MSDNEMVAMIVTMLCATGAFVFTVNAFLKTRRGATPPARSDAATEQRLARIEHAVEAIAIEVERIAEGQRFTTKLLSDRAAVPVSTSAAPNAAHAEAAHVR